MPNWRGAEAGADTRPGRVTGGIAYTLPSWFKASFLDFRADVEEARGQGKQVMVFLHLDECPYCARMLAENFDSGANREFVQKHFDVIAVNVQGSLSLNWTDGATYTEKTLARHLKTIATPTIVFLDQDGGNVLQLTGYRDPAAFRLALEFVQSKSYRKQSFAAYLSTRKKAVVYSLRDHARFHDTTLNRPDVAEEMKKFLFVRFDAESDTPIVGLDGSSTTPARWVKALNLSYRPGVVLFDEGREIYRIDARLYHY
ncbi:MAG: thioredoxin fold domain-containing protein [Burkholderiales bacterium]|nr:thioredoxin fold domain-containing protein [Burkholderiales bacterium]